jgi:CRISPR-associated protein Csa3
MFTTHLVFVGHHKERLLDSIRMPDTYPVVKVILIVGEQQSSGEERSRNVAAEIANEIAGKVEVELALIDKIDVFRGASQIVSLIHAERDAGRSCLINMSGSLRTFAVSAYIAGCVTSSTILTSIPKYDDEGCEVGVEEMVPLQLLPLAPPGKEQMELLVALGHGAPSLDELIFRLHPLIEKDTRPFYKERSRISHHLKKLDENGYIHKTKSGKNIQIEPSQLGMLMLLDRK